MSVCWLLNVPATCYSVSQGRVCSYNFACCHAEIEVVYQTCYLTHSWYTDTGSTSPSADAITQGVWQGSHRSANFQVYGVTRPEKFPTAQVADQTYYRTWSQYTDTRPTSPSINPSKPGAWQGIHKQTTSCHWYDFTGDSRGAIPVSPAPEADA